MIQRIMIVPGDVLRHPVQRKLPGEQSDLHPGSHPQLQGGAPDNQRLKNLRQHRTMETTAFAESLCPIMRYCPEKGCHPERA